MAKLISRERILRAIRHEEVDRVPISPRCGDYLYNARGCECVLHYLWMADQFDQDIMMVYNPDQNNYLLHHVGPYNDLPDVAVEMETEDTGNTLTVRRKFKTPAGILQDTRSVVRPGSSIQFDHVIEAPVKNRSDLDKISYLLPSPDEAYIGDIPLIREAIGDRGVVTVRATQGVDQLLMDSLGVQNALMMYYDDRDLLKELLRIFQDYHRAILKRILEQGVEISYEPWYNLGMGTGWSPQQFRELCFPLIKENADLIHSYGTYVDFYDDGKMDGALEYLAEAGVDIVETLAPPPLGDIDLASAKKRIGKQVCLKGHIDQINLIRFGKPQQIRDAVRSAIETAAPGGGFIIGTADSIRAESPPENVQAYFDAAHEFGKM